MLPARSRLMLTCVPAFAVIESAPLPEQSPRTETLLLASVASGD